MDRRERYERYRHSNTPFTDAGGAVFDTGLETLLFLVFLFFGVPLLIMASPFLLAAWLLVKISRAFLGVPAKQPALADDGHYRSPFEKLS